MDYLVVIFRTLFFYILITTIYRFMGKREIGQLGIIDLIVSILIAELAAISIDNQKESIFLSVIPILILVGIQISLSFASLKNSKIRKLFDGNPSVIINKGKINFNEMVKQRYNLEDLLTQLREKHVRNIEEVDYAVLETSGKLSVFKNDVKEVGQYPLPLILDGVVDNDTLKQINKNNSWLNKTLKKENVGLNDVFYAFYRNEKLYIIKSDELKNK
ncbi:MAG: DUF421 domain-containing protein [bacterium]|nr:DUF421 domain-containing protein [bacterium]